MMAHCLRFKLTLLVRTMITVHVTQSTIVHETFRKLDPGHNITGTIVQQFNTSSKLRCSNRCSGDPRCDTSVYQGTGPGNCLLIHSNSTITQEETFQADYQRVIYRKDYCGLKPCGNHGDCLETDYGFKCVCQDGFYGNRCEEEDNCFPSNNCRNGATCIHTNQSYTCQCTPGYRGNFCEEEDNCYPSKGCLNGGMCVDGNSSFTCSCPSGLTGIHCELCGEQSGGTWTQPSVWNGPDAALYRSFDDSHGLILRDGSQLMNKIPFVSGHVNCGWSLDRTRSQWIDLGVQTGACMTRPDTCGAAGGAISLWLRVIDCPSFGGILSSYVSGKTASAIYCNNRYTTGYVYPLGGYFYRSITKSSAWTHIVMNYLGPNNNQGLTMYENGRSAGSDVNKKAGSSHQTASGRIVAGRQYTESNQNYAFMQIDEFVFFNISLNNEEIQAIVNVA